MMKVRLMDGLKKGQWFYLNPGSTTLAINTLDDRAPFGEYRYMRLIYAIHYVQLGAREVVAIGFLQDTIRSKA